MEPNHNCDDNAVKVVNKENGWIVYVLYCSICGVIIGTWTEKEE